MESHEDLHVQISELKKDIEEIKRHVVTEVHQVQHIPAQSTSFDIATCADLFKALANEERLKLLVVLEGDDLYFSQLVEATTLDHSPLRFHLTVLRDVGLISQERFRGKYGITDLGKRALEMASYFYNVMYPEKE
ncbi:MAG TPA: ArsR family transcriptional regulator [Methanomicrobia archaeon]|nr:ArsR family transcriptional regulator [Methanomicrobia archaeon]